MKKKIQKMKHKKNDRKFYKRKKNINKKVKKIISYIYETVQSKKKKNSFKKITIKTTTKKSYK